ncbi:MAG TPA: plastocyanin/azurin family copper-binding protein [Acidimicrobiia bacterium]|nr:plastocyanin/azurin family copper-binding protein [Acidimicrobiia bacterium]
MRGRFAFVVPILVGFVVLTGCGSNSGAKSGSGTTAATINPAQYVDKTSSRTVTIAARDDFFTPQFTKIRKGTTVVFENDGRNDHNVVSADDTFTNIGTDAFSQGRQAKVVFDKPGTHNFYCSLHGTPTNGMYGSLLVVP